MSAKTGLKDEIFRMSQKQWKVDALAFEEQEWDYFHFVDIGLHRMHHGFWNYFDEKHVQFEPGNPYQSAIPEYYLWLDQQIGKALEIPSKDTVVLVVSDHGAQRLDGGIAVNEWLIREGLLVLNEYPKTITPFDQLSVERRRILRTGFFQCAGSRAERSDSGGRVRNFSG
jgi:predicted AlkP superfamily phosphohydrolase/phosphomutase